MSLNMASKAGGQGIRPPADSTWLDTGLLTWGYVVYRYMAASNYGVHIGNMKTAEVLTSEEYTEFRERCFEFAVSMPGEYGASVSAYISWGVLVSALVVSALLPLLIERPEYTEEHADDIAVRAYMVLAFVSFMSFSVSLMAGVQLLQVLPWSRECELPCMVLSKGIKRMMFHAGMGVVNGIILTGATIITSFYWYSADYFFWTGLGIMFLFAVIWGYDANVANGDLFFFRRKSANSALQDYFTKYFLDSDGRVLPHGKWPVGPDEPIHFHMDKIYDCRDNRYGFGSEHDS